MDGAKTPDYENKFNPGACMHKAIQRINSFEYYLSSNIKFAKTMITGAHSIIYSSDAQADIDFFKNVLKFPNVDVGHGWLIFGLPPSQVAVHPAAENGLQELYLLCDDIEAFVKEMAAHNVPCTAIDSQRWGLITHLTVPGGGKLGVYEPRHARP